MPGYWNAHSDRDFEDADDDRDFDPQDEAEEAARQLREEIAALKATLGRLSADCEAAVKWAADYERAHGPFKSEPRMPDFMCSF